jgi:hypothetical protein
MAELNKLFERIAEKQTWGHRELKAVINEWCAGDANIKNDNSVRPATIEVGDIVLFHIARVMHPSIIISVEGNVCHSVVLSTKNREHHYLAPVENSRLLQTSYYTTTIASMSLELALENFIGIFDQPKQLKSVKKLLKNHYRKLLQNK